MGPGSDEPNQELQTSPTEEYLPSMVPARRLLPYWVLLLQVVVFHWRILFLPGEFVIPWDLRYFHLPHAAFIARSLSNWELPWWDTFAYAGRPFQANIQTQVFYLPRLAGMALSNLTGEDSVLYWLELELVLHVFLAGVFAYWLLRSLNAGRTAALVGATVYQLGGFFASQAQHLGAVNAAAWLPLAWFAVVNLRQRIEMRWVALLAGALTMSLFSGLPAVTLAVAVSCVLLAVGVVLARMAGVRLVLAVIGGGVGAFLLAAVQLLPSTELNLHSVAKYRYEWMGSGGGLPLQSLVSLVLPNHYDIFDLGKYSQPWNPTFLYLYSSLGGLVLALGAVFVERRKIALVFAGLTAVMGFAMLGDQTPPGKAILLAIPDLVRNGIHPEFMMPAFTLGVSVLAGLGAAAFLKRPVRGWIAVGVIAVDLIAVGSGRPMNLASLRAEPGITTTAFDGSEEALSAVRSLSYGTDPPARIDTIADSDQWVTAAPLLQIPSSNGYDPMALERTIQVRLAFCNGERWGAYYEVARPSSPVLDLVNARYLLSRSALDEPALSESSLRFVKEVPGRHIYENLNYLPRFFFVSTVKRADGLEDAARLLQSASFDPRKEAIVEGLTREPSLGPGTGGSISLIDYAQRELTLDVETPSEQFLVTSETHYPGWRAWVDGKERPIFYTNVAFRGLPIPAGRHRVVMRFEPTILYWGAAISTIAWLALGAIFLALRRRSMW